MTKPTEEIARLAKYNTSSADVPHTMVGPDGYGYVEELPRLGGDVATVANWLADEALSADVMEAIDAVIDLGPELNAVAGLVGPYIDPIVKSGLTPSLDLDFTAPEAILPSWFTRASVGTYFDSAGKLRDAASGALRINHVQGVCRGALIEEGRTNSLPNNTRQGAVAGSPGTLPTGWAVYGATGLTRTLSLVTVNGVDCLGIRFNGTTGDALGTYIDFTSALVNGAANGQTWTLSSFLALAAGSLSPLTNIVLDIREYTSGGVTVARGDSGNLKASIGASLLRRAFTRTFAGGGTVAKAGCALSITCASGVAVDFTILIGLPQLEQGAFATSAIKTIGSAATRAADSLLVSGSDFTDNYNQNEGAFLIDFTMDNAPPSGQAAVFYVHDGTVNNRIGARVTSSGTLQVIVVTSSVTQALFDVGNVVLGSKNRLSVTFAVNNIMASLNGGAAVSDTSAAIPVVDRLEVGNLSAFAGYLNGGVSRFAYFPKALSGAKLQEMSSL